MSGRWKYELLVCSEAGVDHSDECGAWTVTAAYFDRAFQDAFTAASAEQHAMVRTVSPFNGNTATSFHHIAGGGLCEWCGPATGRRGPWMRTPNQSRFMCSTCVADGEASMAFLHEANGWPRSRSYWPVLKEV
ncbi:hypothetical protein ACWC5I_01975 [Kitasatospora sp. NPDC001574]